MNQIKNMCEMKTTADSPSKQSPMDHAEIIDYFQKHGLLAGHQAQLIPLAGGVSSDILLVVEGGKRFVFKRSLEKLRVEDDWHCSTARNITECEAIRYASQLFPESVPRIIHADPENRLFAMEYFDSEYSPWKQQLLEGIIDLRIAERIAVVLATLHTESWLSADVRQRFDTADDFFALRVEPYLLTTGQRHPELQHEFQNEADRLQQTLLALVHGDWSAKNFLVSRERVVILDWEAACFGDPAFDAAFFLNLIYLKSLHRPARLIDYMQLMQVFRTEYGNRVYRLDGDLERRIVRLTLMLMLGRIDGKSRAEYIVSERDKDLVRSFVRQSLIAGVDTWEEVDHRWQMALTTS
ncbi:MAG: aminoglycoside phosphotransferase family protein [Pirellulales bacterium]